MNYLDVKLGDGEKWQYVPPTGHDVLWISVYAGSLVAGETVSVGELVVFEPSEQSVEFVAQGDCGFILGSAVQSPDELVLGYHSVHTTPQALQQGEENIQRLKAKLREAGRISD
jgi:redox-sensitive bicupin YhaK (pirin superfamily)